METRFERLLTPIRLGGRRAPSRVVFAAHRTNLATRGRFTERHVAYYEARARGGAGIVVLETASVHPSDRPTETAICGHDPGVEVGIRDVATAVHRHGALVVAQLGHAGGQGTSHWSQAPLWAPSPVPEVGSREVPMEMEPEDVATIALAFGRAAALAMRGGVDGVEIDAGEASLIRQFLSPLTNRRADEHGGSLENRLRFARQVLEAVRKEAGLVGLRISGDEYAPWAGLKPDDAAEVAAALAGGCDYVAVTSGSIYSRHLARAGLYAAPGHAAHLAGAIKAKVGVPVFAQGSIVDPEMAEALLAEGRADAVEMTRALIADPELVAKLRAGRRADVRPCVLCNQDCVVETVQNPIVSCVHNPAAGHELEPEHRAPRRAERRRRVLVVGGGPAGMEAARVAALRGHEVTLVEKDAELGGAVRLAASPPGRARLALVVDWLRGQIANLGVTVETGRALDADAIVAHDADAVVLALGAEPGRRPLGDALPILDPRQVLAGEVPGPPGHAVILDEIGDQTAMGCAEHLAGRGWKVTVATADLFVGQKLTATLELTPWNQRAARQGIVFRPQLEVVRVERGAIVAVHPFSRAPARIEPVDLVVDVAYERPREELYFELRRRGVAVVRAGDCVAPRRVSAAILEGGRAGRAL